MPLLDSHYYSQPLTEAAVEGDISTHVYLQMVRRGFAGTLFKHSTLSSKSHFSHSRLSRAPGGRHSGRRLWVSPSQSRSAMGHLPAHPHVSSMSDPMAERGDGVSTGPAAPIVTGEKARNPQGITKRQLEPVGGNSAH